IEILAVLAMGGLPLLAAAPEVAAVGAAATAGTVGAEAAVVGTSVTTSTGVVLTVIEGGGGAAAVGTAGSSTAVAGTLTKAAAALLVARLVQGGESEARANELVQPLIDKRISALMDVTHDSTSALSKPGGAVTLDGQTFRAIVRLTTRNEVP